MPMQVLALTAAWMWHHAMVASLGARVVRKFWNQARSLPPRWPLPPRVVCFWPSAPVFIHRAHVAADRMHQ